MSIKKIRTKIFIYCEGESEKNYFQALKGNKQISQDYILESNSNENDLDNAIKKFERLGLDLITLYVYDADTFKQGLKKISDKHKQYKDYIYFSDENFEDFLSCHKANPFYRDGKKPHLSRQLIEEIRSMNYNYLKNHLKNQINLEILNQSINYLKSYLKKKYKYKLSKTKPINNNNIYLHYHYSLNLLH